MKCTLCAALFVFISGLATAQEKVLWNFAGAPNGGAIPVGSIAFRHLLSAVLILLTIVCPAAAIEGKNVLILDTYSAGDQLTNLLESDLRSQSPWNINFYVENIEVWRFDDQAYERALLESLMRVYRGRRLDVIMARAYPALQFAVKYRDQLFPGVPIVFYQIVSERIPGEKWPGVTGEMWTANYLRSTINLALRLHPDTDTIAVIANDSKFDQYWLGRLHTELSRLPKLTVIDLVGLSASELFTKVAALPLRTVILFQETPQRSGDQIAAGYDEALWWAEHHRPTYCSFAQFCVGHGGIGGVGHDIPKQMLVTAELARRVLAGERADDIPIVNDTEQVTKVDWRQLRYWNIRESDLPPGTIVLYREPTIWERDRKYILAALGVIVVQAILIFGLLWQRARKRKAEAVLRESEKRFRVLANNAPVLIWMSGADKLCTYFNKSWLEFTGRSLEAELGNGWSEGVHPDDLQKCLGTYTQSFNQREPFRMEYRLRRFDGEYRWILDIGAPRFNPDNSFVGYIGSAFDVTERKEAETALSNIGGRLLEAHEEERRHIARELHDDISQKLALLTMELTRANRNVNGSPEVTKSHLEEMRQHCSAIARDVQSLSHQLHYSKLDYLGLPNALRGFCKEFAKQYEVRVEFTEEHVPRNLPRNISLCLFRVAQEALHNAIKYSGTTEFTVNLTGKTDEIQLVVSDAGAGFDVEEAKRNSGLGLLSMQERVNLVHGHFRIESRPGDGTKVVASVPFAASESATA